MKSCQVLLGGRSGPFVGLGLGAGNRMKALEQPQLIELAAQIVSRTPATLVLVGTAVDQPAAAELLSLLPAGRVLDTTGQWTLAELPSLLAGLDCFAGVDSGATYMADALGVPVVDFMGPADANDQRPVGPKAVVIRSKESCAPCSHAFEAPYRCHLGTRVCITRVPLDEISKQVGRLLSEKRSVSEY
jgi:ADP-heptose:LPS heptosyltransferase